MGACCFKPMTAEEGPAQNSESPSRGGPGGSEGGRASRPGPGNRLLCRKAPKWDADAGPMTIGQLLSKRDEFWETAPAFTGRAEVWLALRAAAECEEKETAQAILDASNVTLPHGNMSVVYDELGNRYDLPPYCLSEPTNMIQTEGGGSGGGDHSGGGGGARGEAQGTTPDAPVEEEATVVKVRLRMSTGSELAWEGAHTTTIGALKAHVSKEEGIDETRQRFLFSGKLLDNAQTLSKAGVQEDSVVQIMVRPADME